MMPAVFVTLVIVVLACKMAAADVSCYECTADNEDVCEPRRSDTIYCSHSIELDMEKLDKKHKETMSKMTDEHYQRMREMNEESLCSTKRFLKEFKKMLRNSPEYNVLNDLKLIEFDDTIPTGAQSERAGEWIREIQDFLQPVEQIDLTLIEEFNKEFRSHWKKTYEYRVNNLYQATQLDAIRKEEHERWEKLTEADKNRERAMMTDVNKKLQDKFKAKNICIAKRDARQSDDHRYLISTVNTSDSWCATFESKDFGFHRGCGVLLKGFEFERGCHTMTGEYAGVRYCRCDKDRCNNASKTRDKLNGMITILFIATVMANLL